MDTCHPTPAAVRLVVEALVLGAGDDFGPATLQASRSLWGDHLGAWLDLTGRVACGEPLAQAARAAVNDDPAAGPAVTDLVATVATEAAQLLAGPRQLVAAEPATCPMDLATLVTAFDGRQRVGLALVPVVPGMLGVNAHVVADEVAAGQLVALDTAVTLWADAVGGHGVHADPRTAWLSALAICRAAS